MWALDEKVILITGASRGIGKSIAMTLGNAGGTIIGTATSKAGADKVSAYLQDAGIKGKGLILNVTSDESISTLIAAITSEFGMPDILVNNAGITQDNLLLRMKEKEWNEVIDTNLSSIYKLSKVVLKGMTKARFGRIINIASVVAVMGNPGQCNYAAAKAGIIGFSKSLAREVASRNITVNVVAPGFIDTDMTRELSEQNQQALIAQIPANKLGSTQDIANAVLFLSSNAASYITGETLHVNGGMSMI